MNVIKTNYNNAFVKKPKVISPSFSAFRDIHVNEDESITKRIILTIYNNMAKEPFFTDYHIYVYINNELFCSCNKRSNNIIIIEEDQIENILTPTITITGYYINENGYEVPFDPVEAYLVYGAICSTKIKCSNRIKVTHINQAYLNVEDNLLYEDIEFTIPVELDIDKIYLDKLSNSLYKWNSERECYILI